MKAPPEPTERDVVAARQTVGATSPDPAIRISVIITNYNYEAYLGAAIRSVLDQTHPDVECIVVDDGSTDGSLAVARGFPGIVVVEKPNGGQVSAAKAGIAHATGAITLFLDSDDALYPATLAAIAAAYDPAATLYQGRLDIVDTGGRRIGGYPDAPLIRGGEREHVLRHGFFPSAPTSGNAFATAHVRRMLAVADREERYFVDGYLIFSAPFFGTVVPVDATFGRYLVHGGNVSLSAGVTQRSSEKGLRNAIWQRTGIVAALRETGVRDDRAAIDFLPAWHLRHLLVQRRTYRVTDVAPDRSTGWVASRAIARMLTYPGISARQRATNVGFLIALAAGARRLGRKIVPPNP